MTEKNGPGQADKKAADERTAQVARDNAQSAAELSTQIDAADAAVNPYPNYDMMPLDELRALAKDRGVEINRDVEKAHLITELRAADTGVRNTGQDVR